MGGHFYKYVASNTGTEGSSACHPPHSRSTTVPPEDLRHLEQSTCETTEAYWMSKLSNSLTKVGKHLFLWIRVLCNTGRSQGGFSGFRQPHEAKIHSYNLSLASVQKTPTASFIWARAKIYGSKFIRVFFFFFSGKETERPNGWGYGRPRHEPRIPVRYPMWVQGA